MKINLEYDSTGICYLLQLGRGTDNKIYVENATNSINMVAPLRCRGTYLALHY